MFLRELFEAEKKTAVIAFGRLNPPTIGHAKLVDAIKSQEGDHYLFLSHTQKPKTDPLDFATKMKFAKQFFPGINVGHEGVRTPVQALEMMQSLGYTDVIFIAGSDRVDGFQSMFDKYNGQPDKSGNVPFKFNSIKVVSAGERDPDADGAEGMSASKMRAAAAADDLEAFAQGVPDKKLAQTMYDAVRAGMGVKDTIAAEDVSPEEEDEFHVALDRLVHKYFGHSSDEKKEKEVKEWVGPVLKGGKYAFQIAKFFWNNKWAIGFLTATWKTIDWIGDAIALVKKYTDNPIVQGLMRYGLPAVAVGVALYGGKKLYDELVQVKTEKDLEKVLMNFKVQEDELAKLEAELDAMVSDKKTNEILGFATRTPKRNVVKRRPPEPEEDSVQDKLKKRRALASKVGVKKAFRSDAKLESDVVLDKTSVRNYIRDMIMDYLNKEDDIEKLSKILKMLVGKEVKSRGSRYQVTKEDIIEACKSMRKKRRG